VIFISILLTICTIGKAQPTALAGPVRLVFTSDFQHHPFGQDPVWGGWPEGSMARAMSYIRSHRRAMGEDRFALLACGTTLKAPYSYYPENMASQISDYIGFERGFERGGISFDVTLQSKQTVFSFGTSGENRVLLSLISDPDITLEKIAGIDHGSPVHLLVAAFGREPEVCRVITISGDTTTVLNLGNTGKYIGVADFNSPSDFTVKTVDISGFPADAEYMEHFQQLYDSVRAFYDTPIATLADTLRQSGALFGPTAYTALFHRFQLEITRAEVSFFAPPLTDDVIPAGEITGADLLRRFRYENHLMVLRLTGKEIQQYIEYAYGLRYNTMRRLTDDLLRMSRDRDGVLQLRTAVYNLDEAFGVDYQVDVSRPQGRRVKVTGMSDGTPFRTDHTYRVVLNSHRLSGDHSYLSRATGLSGQAIEQRIVCRTESDFRYLLWDWLSRKKEIVPENSLNWEVLPETFIKSSKARIY